MLVSLIELASELSLAQDNTFQNSMAEQFIPPLLSCLGNIANPDMILNAMTCLTQIMDICPNTCSKIVSNNGVQCLVNKLVDPQYIDLAESVIKALEKISYENAHSIMEANGITAMVTTMPFFDQLIQKKILKIVCFTVRCATSLLQYDAFILPSIPALASQLSIHSKSLIEEISETIESICNTLFKFISFSPTNVGTLRTVFGKIFCRELVEALLNILTYSVNQIDGSISSKSWSGLMTILLYGAKFNPYVLKECLSNGVIQMLNDLLINKSEMVDYAISLTESMLPKKYLISNSDPKEKDRFKLECDKEEIWAVNCSLSTYMVKNILPKLMTLFEERSVQASKLYSIQAIIKIMQNATPVELMSVLIPKQFALTAFILLDSCDLMYTSLGLELIDISLRLSKSFLQCLKREGIEDLIKKLNTPEAVSDMKEIQFDKLWYINENPFIKYFCNYAAVALKAKTPFPPSQGIRKYVEIKTAELLAKFNQCDDDKSESELQRAQKVVKLLRTNDFNKTTTNSLCAALLEITRYELVRSDMLEALSTIITKPDTKEEESKLGVITNYKEGAVAEVTKKQEQILNGLYNNSIDGTTSLHQLIKLLHSLLYTIDKPSTDSLGLDVHQHFVSSSKKVTLLLRYCPTTPQELSNAIKQKTVNKLNPPNLDKMGLFFQHKHSLFQVLDNVNILVNPHRQIESYKKLLLEKISTKDDIEMLRGKRAFEGFSEVINTMDKSSEIYKKLQLIIKETPMIDPIDCFDGVSESESIPSELGDMPAIDGMEFKPLSLLSSDAAKNKCISELANKSPHKYSSENYDIEFIINGEVINHSQSFYEVMSKSIQIKGDYPSEFANEILFKIIPSKIKEQSPIALKSIVDKDSTKKLERILLELDKFDFGKPFNDAARILFALSELTTQSNIYFDQTKNIKIQEDVFVNSKISAIIEKLVENPPLIWTEKYPPWAKYLLESYSPIIKFAIRFQIMKIRYMERHRLLLSSSMFQSKIKYSAQESDTPKIQKIKAKISRKGILENSQKIIPYINNKTAIVEFDFLGEEGTGLGPTLEFYQCAIQCILGQSNAWRTTEQNTYFPKPLVSTADAKLVLDSFMLLGTLCARSIIDERIIDMPVSRLFWNALLSQPLMLNDLQILDSLLYKFIIKLKDYKQKLDSVESNNSLSKEEKAKRILALNIDGEQLASLNISFVVPGSDYILKEGGKDILLSNTNIEEYIDTLLVALFDSSITQQVECFKKGFNSILPIKALLMLNTKEIEEYYSYAMEKWTMDYLKENIKADHGYNDNSAQLQYLREYMLGLDSKQQRLYIQYITGSPRLPFGGTLFI